MSRSSIRGRTMCRARERRGHGVCTSTKYTTRRLARYSWTSGSRAHPTHDPVRHIWTRLGVLESVSGAKRHLARRAADLRVDLDDQIASAKAHGLAFTVRSAKEYFRVPIEGNLTLD